MQTGAQPLMLIVLMLPFLGAAFAPVLFRMLGSKAGWLLTLVPLFAFWRFATQLGAIADGKILAGGYSWIPSLDVRFSWYLDGLSLTFALLISGIGALILLYSSGYLRGHPMQGRFFSFMLLFMGSMQGLVVSDSFLMLFVFWELTSITSFLLIGFDHYREAARRAALQALLVTGMGGLSLLAGLLVIWNITGQHDMSALLKSGGMLAASPLYPAALLLVLGGAFTKSAQFPFHFWLPNAMEAPTPVSAYLHSATMVKAGVFLLMRLNPVLGDTVLWETILPVFGGATLLVGTLLAMRQIDLKLMLAYTTVASLGLLVMLVGIGSEEAIKAAVLYLIAHCLFKGALFMVAGTVDHEAGSRDITHISGLRGAMPITFAAAVLAACSMGGVPLFLGFLAKEQIYEALAHGDAWITVLTVVAVAGNALMFAAGFAVAFKPFLGPRRQVSETVHEGAPTLWLGPVVLSVSGLAAGCLSTLTHRYFSSPMASAVAGIRVEQDISTVPHWGFPLLLSVITIAIGIGAYWRFDSVRATMSRTLETIGWGPDRGFDQAISGTIRVAALLTRIVQNGRMDIYMAVTFTAIGLAALIPMLIFGELPAWPAFPDLAFYEWAFFAIAVIGLGAVIVAKDRLTAIVSLGVQGFSVAVIFLLLGAPDLSFTQFMVETLSVVILALVMTRLKLSPSDHRPPMEKAIDIPISVLCGGALGLLLLKVTQLPFDDRLTEFFNSHARVVAHGRNIVNVIIVDFRGLDTLGEITVVMVTGLAILALIRIRAGSVPSEEN